MSPPLLPARSLPAWWPRRGSQDPIPSRTRPSKAPAPMVLCLKARESRSPPGPQRSCPEPRHPRRRDPNPSTPHDTNPRIRRSARALRPGRGTRHKEHRPAGRSDNQDRIARQGGATTKIASPPAGRSDNQGDAGWSSPVARQAHNLKAAGSNPAPATNLTTTTPAPHRSHPQLNPSAPNLARGPDTSPLVGKILVPEAALALGRLRRNRRCNVLHVVAVAVVEAADPVGVSNDASHAAARSKAISAAPESAKASFRSRRSRAGAACWPERMASSSRAEQSRQVHSCSSATSLRVVHPLESDRCGRSASGQAKGVPSTSAGHHGTAAPERAALASCRKT